MPASIATLRSLELGTVRLTFLPDGATRQKLGGQYVNTPPDVWSSHPQYLDENGHMLMSFGAFLVESGGRRALVDLGFGPIDADLTALSGGFVEGTATGGELLTSLKAAGFDPADIDTVVFTHLHSDHVGWTADAADGQAVFPNARYLVSDPEWNHWRQEPEDSSGAAPSPAAMAVIGTAVELVDDGDEPLPGVRILATPGHTAGHLSVVAGTGHRKAVVLGDAFHCPIEFADENIGFALDENPDVTRATKRRLIQEFGTDGGVLACGHFPDPVWGTVTTTRMPTTFAPLDVS